MSPRINTLQHSSRLRSIASAFNADAVAITPRPALAALIRFNVIHHIGW